MWKLKVGWEGSLGFLILSFDYIGFGFFEILEENNVFNILKSFDYIIGRSYNLLLKGY